MSGRGTLALFATLALVGCSRHADPEAHDHAEPPAQAGRHEHADAVARVHVHETMLRDLHLTIQPVEVRPAGDTITALGELRVNEERYAEIGTAIEARVARVLAAPGDAVSAGQPLVELESLEVGRARAQRTAAEARAKLAESTLARKRTLADEQIAARSAVQIAEAELTQATAEARAATDVLAALGASSGRGARFVMTSPLAGRVLARTALPGRRVDAEHALFVVADLTRLWLTVHAFERDALRLQPGAAAHVAFTALPGEARTGTVARVGTQVDPVSRTVDVRIDLDNPDGRLLPGMSATARVAVGAASATVVTVPMHALQRVADGWAVFLPTSEASAFEVRPVGRGRDLEGEVEIVSGLRSGERVVVDGAFLLKAQVERARGGGESHHH